LSKFLFLSVTFLLSRTLRSVGTIKLNFLREKQKTKMNKLFLDLLIMLEVLIILAATTFLAFVAVMVFSVTEALGGFTEACIKTLT